MPGLRERKKLHTRQLIADTAARLFAERGFDAVTVDEVAEAAEVARKTVFNYFPTKEDLILDRVTEYENALIGIVRDRPAGVALVTVFRQRSVALICERGGQLEGTARAKLIALAESCPALQRAVYAKRANLIHALATEIATATGAPAHDPLAYTAAISLLGAYRALAREYDRRHDTGQDPAGIVLALQAEATRVFDLLENGLAGYAPGPPSELDEPTRDVMIPIMRPAPRR